MRFERDEAGAAAPAHGWINQTARPFVPQLPGQFLTGGIGRGWVGTKAIWARFHFSRIMEIADETGEQRLVDCLGFEAADIGEFAGAVESDLGDSRAFVKGAVPSTPVAAVEPVAL